jgi:hypothetical protein
MSSLRVVSCSFAALAAAGCWNAPAIPPSPTVGGIGPRLKVLQTTVDLGEVDDRAAVVRSFPFENVGDKPFHVAVLRRSCSCEDVTGPDADVPPGGSGSVTFRWTPALGTVGHTTVSAEVQTNDPKTPTLRLELTSRVAPRIRISPVVSFIDFDNVRPGETRERGLKVFSPTLAAFDLDAALTGDGVELTKTPLPPGDLVEDATAMSGYRLTLKTTPKLPAGYYRAELTLTVKPPKVEGKTTTMPVYVMGDNAIFQAAPSQIEFTRPLGLEDETKTVRVQFVVPSDKDSVEVVRCEPSFLRHTAPIKLGGGTWQFQVTLPKDAAAAKQFALDGFFEGEVVLKTAAAEGQTAVRVKWQLPEN